MNIFNDLCIEKYKPDTPVSECVAQNYSYNPDVKYSEERMAKENPGCFLKFRFVMEELWICS